MQESLCFSVIFKNNHQNFYALYWKYVSLTASLHFAKVLVDRRATTFGKVDYKSTPFRITIRVNLAASAANPCNKQDLSVLNPCNSCNQWETFIIHRQVKIREIIQSKGFYTLPISCKFVKFVGGGFSPIQPHNPCNPAASAVNPSTPPYVNS